jgi:hypothetical protein
MVGYGALPPTQGAGDRYQVFCLEKPRGLSTCFGSSFSRSTKNEPFFVDLPKEVPKSVLRPLINTDDIHHQVSDVSSSLIVTAYDHALAYFRPGVSCVQ